MSVTTAPRPQRLHRLERPAITGVLVREVVNFMSYWRSATFSSTVEPTIYLLAFGFGFGALVNNISGYDPLQFVATGTVAAATAPRRAPSVHPNTAWARAATIAASRGAGAEARGVPTAWRVVA